MKDWVGDKASVFRTNGCSNHSDGEREPNDYYATDPKALQLLLDQEDFNHKIWECACGGGHLSEALKDNDYEVYSTDLVDRGYKKFDGVCDFLKWQPTQGGNDMDIITNPPYKYAKEFVEHALDCSVESVKVAMFLKLTFLEGKARKKLFKKYPPKIVYVSSGRLNCAKNGEFDKYHTSAIAYGWFIWEKGYKGDTVVKWIN